MTVQFRAKEFTFTQPDGTQIQVRGWGDQFHAAFETLDGYTVVKDPISGFYQYASLSGDGNDLLPTGVNAGAVDPGALNLAPHLRLNRVASKQKALAAVRKAGTLRRWEVRRQRKKEKLFQVFKGFGPSAAPPAQAIIGQFVGLCLLIQFPDVPATITREQVEAFCNQPGYSGYGNRGSVSDYFLDNSKGKLQYTSIVPAYYTAKNVRSYYTNPAIAMPQRALELIKEALADLKTRGLDFNQLSADDEGYVYALNVFYAGRRVNNWNEGLWPHSFHLSSPVTLSPGRLAYDYQITDMGNELTLGTFCHENGHMVCDFPDLYDYGYQSSGVGDYCLMCGGGDEKNPVQVSAYLKYKAGWATKLQNLTDNLQASVSSAENDFWLHPKNLVEYFILENRQKQGRDASIPCPGLAIWHVDELASNDNEQMSATLHYECSLEQADGRFDLERNVNSGDPGDCYRAPNATRFADDTNPGSRWWDGTSSRLQIFEVSAPGPAMTFRASFSTGAGGGGATKVWKKNSAPGKAIPDNQAAGIKDTLNFPENATLVSLKLSVDLTHTYRGDLRLTLIPPSGPAVVLHDRQGGRSADLQTTYDFSSTPGLSNLAGQPIQGDWTLHVQDMAAADKGTLNRWELEIQGTQAPVTSTVITREDSPGVNIPDDNTQGVERTISVTQNGKVQEVEVSVDITHTYIGDLIVTLTSPAGTGVDLHRRRGGTTDNLIKTFDLNNTPALSSLAGESLNGSWKLKVADVAGQDKGKLNRWSLKIIPQP